MPSQIKVDEIKNVAGQYEIKTNTFKGQTTGGSIAVQGEGTATTNLQQGLTKIWFQFTGVSTASLNDSLNVSSLTDNTTGTYTITYSNNMANTTYSYSNGSGWDVGVTNSTYNGTDKDQILTATLVIYHVNAGDALRDANLSMGSIHGDLA